MHFCLGEIDCMDESDEKLISNHNACFHSPSAFECDDRHCTRGLWSCGDGQCIPGFNVFGYQNRLPSKNFCISHREVNHMCEASLHWRLWTLPNSGLCTNKVGYDDPNFSMEQTAHSPIHQCIYLIRCALSQGFERDCICDHKNCSIILKERCSQQHMYAYPNGSLVRPYIHTFYSFNRSWLDRTPDKFQWYGAIKCRGYQGFINKSDQFQMSFNVEWATSPYLTLDVLFCEKANRHLSSFVQFDPVCWNYSYTFNNQLYAVDSNTCPQSLECISRYRIRDGTIDCLDGGDETYLKVFQNPCGNQQKYRLRCHKDDGHCLPVTKFPLNFALCSNAFDLFVYGNGQPLSQVQCWYRNDDGCSFLRNYVKNVSVLNAINPETIVDTTVHIPFWSYCDSFWTLKSHLDELPEFCRHWTCRQNQYQCRTGQCIEPDWVCDGEWDCSDASDEEALISIQTWSKHNLRIPVLSSRVEQCKERSKRQAFTNICNVSFEFPCFVANVKNPLDIAKNRPCILLTRIGDEHEDCFDWQDEKNTLGDSTNEMFGLGLHSTDGGIWGPTLACTDAMPNWQDHPLCFYRSKSAFCSDVNDAVCLNGSCQKNARCNGIHECPHGEDEYRCVPLERHLESHRYRFFKEQFYPLLQKLHWNKLITLSVNRSTKNKQLLPSMKPIHEDDSFKCNRGIAIRFQLDKTLCFCSSMYYGAKCQYYSDRLSVITHLNLTSLPMNEIYPYFRILATFLFNDRAIDYYQYVLNTTSEYRNYTKLRFSFTYPRLGIMLKQKQKRYLNRNDILNHHPYAVRFQVFAMQSNETKELNGIWHYPIYFDYLPSFRLAVVLKYPSWYGNSSYDPCQTVKCNMNSTCRMNFNRNKTFCDCKNGYYGDNCQYFASKCLDFCSSDSICKVSLSAISPTNTLIQCVCPLGSYGPSCHIYHDECKSNTCLNNGTCYSTYNLYGQRPFICVCIDQFYGERCEKEKESIRIHINISDTLLASVVQFSDIHSFYSYLLVKNQQVFRGLPTTIQYNHYQIYPPHISILKTYQKERNPSYFLLYIISNLNGPLSNFTLTPQSCPVAGTLLHHSKLI